MLALKSGDAEADRAAFAGRGLPVVAPFHFSRTARGPDGAEREVAFSLAFTSDARMPEAGFFTCEHHFENLEPRRQRHETARPCRDGDHGGRRPRRHPQFLTLPGQHDIDRTASARLRPRAI